MLKYFGQEKKTLIYHLTNQRGREGNTCETRDSCIKQLVVFEFTQNRFSLHIKDLFFRRQQ